MHYLFSVFTLFVLLMARVLRDNCVAVASDATAESGWYIGCILNTKVSTTEEVRTFDHRLPA